MELRRIRGVIDRVVADGTVTAELDGKVHEVFPVAPGPEECDAIQRWVERHEPQATLEVGLGYGISALSICLALVRTGVDTPRHVVIDPFQASRFSNVGLQLLAAAGVAGMVEHHGEESQIVLPRLLSGRRAFDFAFVDGNHRFDPVFVDLFYLGRLLRPGGVSVLDDHQLLGVARAVNFFVQNLRWTIEERSDADPEHQWVVLRTSTQPDDRPSTHFESF